MPFCISLPSILKKRSNPGKMNICSSSCGLLQRRIRLKSPSLAVACLLTRKYLKIRRKLICMATNTILNSCQASRTLSVSGRLVLVATEGENCGTVKLCHGDETLVLKSPKEKVLAPRAMGSGDELKPFRNMMANQNQH